MAATLTSKSFSHIEFSRERNGKPWKTDFNYGTKAVFNASSLLLTILLESFFIQPFVY